MTKFSLFHALEEDMKRIVFKKNTVVVLKVHGKQKSGNPAHTNAWICSHYAPSVPKRNIFALTRLDQNRATGQIAHHFGLSVAWTIQIDQFFICDLRRPMRFFQGWYLVVG